MFTLLLWSGLRANVAPYWSSYMAPTLDQGWKIYVGTLTTIVPATLAVGARFLARWIGGIHYWWDDWMVLIALVCLLHVSVYLVLTYRSI